MRFSETVKEAKEPLQGKGRVTYRALKLEFDLDDERLDVLKDELIKAERVATDEGGEILVWTGNGEPSPVSARPEPQPQSPATYTSPTPGRAHPGRASSDGIPRCSRRGSQNHHGALC